MVWLLKYLPQLALLAALTGGVWWYGENRFDVGFAAGERVGFRRGAEAASREADQSMLRLLAEARSERDSLIEQARRHDQDRERAFHEARAIDAAGAAARNADLARGLDDLRRRLRNAAARAGSGNANPVPSSANDPARTDGTASAGSGLVLRVAGIDLDAAERYATACAASAVDVLDWRAWARSYEGWRFTVTTAP